jgi:hypothetical protein
MNTSRSRSRDDASEARTAATQCLRKQTHRHTRRRLGDRVDFSLQSKDVFLSSGVSPLKRIVLLAPPHLHVAFIAEHQHEQGRHTSMSFSWACSSSSLLARTDLAFLR